MVVMVTISFLTIYLIHICLLAYFTICDLLNHFILLQKRVNFMTFSGLPGHTTQIGHIRIP